MRLHANASTQAPRLRRQPLTFIFLTISEEKVMSTSKNQRASTQPSSASWRPAWLKGLSIFVKLLAGFFVLGCLVCVLFQEAIPSASETARVANEQPHYPRIYDRDGRPIGPGYNGAYPLPGVPHNGQYTPVDSLARCVVRFAKELEGFDEWRGLGVKPLRLPVAWRNELGGSTITMQSARRLFFAKAREDSLFELSRDSLRLRQFGRDGAGVAWQAKKTQYFRKGFEIFTATNLAEELSERERLELYFNISSFLPERRGIGYASGRLFGKAPSDLTCKQGALLLTLLPNPSLYREKDREAFLAKFQRKIDRLHGVGLISKAQHDDWWPPEPFEIHTRSVPQFSAASDRAIREAQWLLEGTPYDLGDVRRIHTSIDGQRQTVAYEELLNKIDAPRVKATLVGLNVDGFHELYIDTGHEKPGSFDHIAHHELPGSRIKAAIYMIAVAHLREEGYTFSEILESYELPTEYRLREDNGDAKVISNCGKFGPTVSIRKAIKESCNGAAYWVVNELLSPEKVYSFLQGFGIELDEGAHKALSTGNFNLPAEHLAALYNGLFNTHTFSPPRIVTKIVAHDGTVIDEAPRRLISFDAPRIEPEISHVMLQTLRATLEEGGTVDPAWTNEEETAEGGDLGSASYSDVAGWSPKSGTSSNTPTVVWRGTTGPDGQEQGMIFSLTLQGEDIPASTRSSSPRAGDVLDALREIPEQPPLIVKP